MTPITTSEDSFWATVFPVVAAKAVERNPKLADDIENSTHELRRFLNIARSSDSPLAMISAKIDELWHEFISHTITYRRYCSDFVGRFLDHMPRSEAFPIPESAVGEFVSRYENAYGPLPGIWFSGVDPALAEELRKGRNPEGLRWSGYVPTTTTAED